MKSDFAIGLLCGIGITLLVAATYCFCDPKGVIKFGFDVMTCKIERGW